MWKADRAVAVQAIHRFSSSSTRTPADLGNEFPAREAMSHPQLGITTAVTGFSLLPLNEIGKPCDSSGHLRR
ncbi:hypothetical protein VTK26DRAFT_6846 [Humicola hyalothermophila]